MPQPQTWREPPGEPWCWSWRHVFFNPHSNALAISFASGKRRPPDGRQESSPRCSEAEPWVKL